MKSVKIETIYEWLAHPLTHPVVVAACLVELGRRGVCLGQ